MQNFGYQIYLRLRRGKNPCSQMLEQSCKSFSQKMMGTPPKGQIKQILRAVKEFIKNSATQRGRTGTTLTFSSEIAYF